MKLVLWYSMKCELWNILITKCKDRSICLDPFLVREQVKYLTLLAVLQVTDYIHDVTQVLKSLKRKPISNDQ